MSRVRRQPALPAVELRREPISFSVVEDPRTGRAAFSDLPERLIPQLIEAYGTRAVDMVLEASEVQHAFNLTLELRARARARWLDLAATGELDRRAGDPTRARPGRYFMAAINRNDEAIFGRTGVVYLVCKKGCHYCHYRGFDDYEVDAAGLAARMLALEKAGADNVQWLSPTSYTGLLLGALSLAAGRGFSLPIVHKGEGEDALEDLARLDGVVDVYLPDLKFVTPEFAPKVGLPPSYVGRMSAAIREMHRQVGPLARRPGSKPLEAGGLLVRHLLMPGGAEEATKVLDFVASIDPRIPVRVMTAYQPVSFAKDIPEIARTVTEDEIRAVAHHAHEREYHHVLVG